MSSRPGRKIARGQAQRERSGRHSAAEIHERRKRSAIVMGIVLLAVTVGVVSALLWSRRDTNDDPDLQVTPQISVPAEVTTTLLPADATSVPTDATTTTVTGTTSTSDTGTTSTSDTGTTSTSDTGTTSTVPS